MKLSRSLLFAALLPVLAYPVSVYAGAESGVYLGAGLGDTNVKGPLDENNIEFDSIGSKIILGYNFGLVPLIDLAVEGAYVNLGEESSGSVSFKQTSWNGFGLAGLSFGPIGLFGKVGMAAWETESRFGALSSTDSGTDPVYGIGARLQLGPLSARIEYEYYDQSNFDDVSMSSVSLIYTF
jgi:outer membrane immunogenic protein